MIVQRQWHRCTGVMTCIFVADQCLSNPQTQSVASWGFNINTASYGETFTLATARSVTGFSVPVSSSSGAGITGAAIGALYAWDGQKATGPALVSQQISINGGTNLMEVSFPAVPLSAGQAYIAFFTTSGLWDGGAFLSFEFEYGQSSNPAIGDGGFRYLNNGNNPSLLTSQQWSALSGFLALNICFTSN